ncbi:MAG: hypothetical protein JW963_04875 [Anaerolineales bacterium]|nr:hypothetical protein [Anaerolineales bacterium]
MSPNNSDDIPRVKVHVVDFISQQRTSLPLALPLDFPSGDLAATVAIHRFDHKLSDHRGNRYEYRFKRQKNNVVIEPAHTLEQAQIQDAETLYLIYIPTAARS